MLDDFVYLKSVADVTPKFTIPGPPVLHFRGGRESISRAAKELIERRVEEATRFVALTEQEQWRKLGLVVEAATNIWNDA